MKVRFYEVHSSLEKLQILEKICIELLEKKIPLHCIIDEPKLLTYVDNLLWSLTQESFFPHRIANEAGKALISLGQAAQAPFTCSHFLNFSKEPFLANDDATIYEFDDQTLPIKRQATQKKYHAYKMHHAEIEAH